MQENSSGCKKCKKKISMDELMSNLYICPACGTYFSIDAYERIRFIVDKDSFKPLFENIKSKNPLDNMVYKEKLCTLNKRLNVSEAVTIGKAKIGGYDVILGVCNTSFLMGTMGYAMGERVTQGFEYATKRKLPIIMFCCSGGARMQEGVVSLMQMEKTSAAVKRHSMAGLFFVSILTNPTMGGVTASFATLGDVILAEPGANIGFAGKRVIEQTIGSKIPENIQTSEAQINHGMIDLIVERKNQRDVLIYLLRIHDRSHSYRNFKLTIKEKKEFENIQNNKRLNSNLTAWQRVRAARSVLRFSAAEYIEYIFDEFTEFHGDRFRGDDNALIGGTALLNGKPVTIIAGLKGKEMEECKKRNFGMPMPEGYRKVLRLMKQAEKFKRPVISFINTPGAYCDLDAETHGQGIAIAKNLYELSDLGIPILCIIIGEGGSGGALATAVGNEVWMLENAVYSVISPEGYASILWKNGLLAEKATNEMAITSNELLKLNIVDKIIPEYTGKNEKSISEISDYMKKLILEFLDKESRVSTKGLIKERYNRFRKY